MATGYLSENEITSVPSGWTIYGSTGTETVNVAAGATNVVLTATIENVAFASDISEYTFTQSGASLNVYAADGTTLVAAIPSNTMMPSFNGLEADIVISGGVMSIGGQALANGASPITVDPGNITSPEVPVDIPTDTPTDSPTQYSNVNASLSTLSTVSTDGVAELNSGVHWNQNSISFSFNDIMPSDYDNEGFTGFTALSDTQKNSLRDIMNQINDVLGVEISEVSGDSDIRFNIIDQGANTAAFAYYPGSGIGGDVFLSTELNDPSSSLDLEVGGFGWSTVVHELGHAFGLEHPFGNYTQDPDQNGEAPHLDTEHDNNIYSIMSYTSTHNYIGKFDVNGNSISYDSANWKVTEATLYPVYDLNTLQYIYGANELNSISDDIYTFGLSDFTYKTIWDTGGVDSFDLSLNEGDTTLDLRAGSVNSIDHYSLEKFVEYYQNEVNYSSHNNFIETHVTDWYNADSVYTGYKNIAIGTGVVIENVTTGTGNDTITDNEVDNIINAALGDDKIYVGNGGYDTVDGGGGTDTLYINVAQSSATVESYEGEYLLYTDSYAVKFDNIELITFSDNIDVSLNTLIA